MEKEVSNKRLIVIVIIAFVIGGYLYLSTSQNSKTGGEQATTASFQDNGQKLSEDIINCEFDVVSDFVYKNQKDAWSKENKKVYYETSSSKTPNLLTFAGLSTREPKIKGNNGDNPVTILKNDTDSIVLVEQNVLGDMFTYTIFKQEKVAVWNKTYKLLVAPYALLSMGYCY
ncbi:MAG: hypothetical protein Q7R98_02310 [Candidatus Jorgensenbacteria bacterium]|nr:hypothetical protein [Candidatus Jorgensenbacteria bacterium]